MSTLNPYNHEEKNMEEYFYIAHLFDRVLIGKKDDDFHDELLEAIEQDSVLEVHFFNKDKEIYASRINEQLMVYEILEHQKGLDENVIIRSYQLENWKNKKGNVNYNTLKVKEYIKFDEDYLAYVDRTVLFQLKREVNKDGE